MPQSTDTHSESSSLFHEPVTRPAVDGAASPFRKYQAMVAVGRRATAPSDTGVFVQDSSAMIAEMLGVEHSAVAQTTASGSRLLVTLSLRHPGAAKTKSVAETTDASGRESMAAYALETARPVAVSDWRKENRFRDPFLCAHGIRSALAVPLKADRRSLGALIAGSSEVHSFSADDVLCAENISHLVATTIARRKAEEALEEERSFSAELLQSVGAMVLVLDPKGRILRVNAACEKITGFSSDDVRHRLVSSVFPVPEEMSLFQVIFEKLRCGFSPVQYESWLLTKHSERRRIAWSYAAALGTDGSIERIIASGIDVTEQREAEKRLREVEENARYAVAQARAEPDEARTAGTEPSGGPWSVLNAERRRKPRHSYPYRQSIGYVRQGALPDPEDFVRMECNDIGSDGFSFFAPQPPQSESLVVALGRPPRMTYLAAQVVHATRVEQNGQQMFLIGCRYTGRVHY